jgi:AraC-like DNA-binding protein
VDVQPLVEAFRLPLGQVFYPDDPGEIAELFRKIMREFNGAEPHREELLDGYVLELFVKLSRSIRKEAMPSADHEKLQQLRWQILSHPEHGWTVEEMARSVSLSSSRLYALYNRQFGVSPMKDVIRCRTEQAKSMLLDSSMPLQTIAERLGYSNHYHFIRQFKTQTGMTPGAYRKKNA